MAAERPAHLDANALARLAEAMAETDPIDWSGVGVEPRLVYDLIASEVAERFAGYSAEGMSAEDQLRLALPALVKLNVETFAMAARRPRGGS